MIIPLWSCKETPKRKIRVRKNWNLREATVDGIFVLFQEWNKQRLLEEIDYYLKKLGDLEKAEINIITEQKRRRRNYPNK